MAIDEGLVGWVAEALEAGRRAPSSRKKPRKAATDRTRTAKPDS